MYIHIYIAVSRDSMVFGSASFRSCHRVSDPRVCVDVTLIFRKLVVSLVRAYTRKMSQSSRSIHRIHDRLVSPQMSGCADRFGRSLDPPGVEEAVPEFLISRIHLLETSSFDYGTRDLGEVMKRLLSIASDVESRHAIPGITQRSARESAQKTSDKEERNDREERRTRYISK